jgi:CheY-like chemotaxis protein
MSSTPNPTRVLIVDDQKNIADTLAAIFRISGYETKAVYSGEDAISIAETFRPDIVITDYAMPPGINGIEAAITIKNHLPGCRVIMLSGQLLGEDFEPYQAKGYNFVLLQKPMHPKQLLDTVSKEGQLGEGITADNPRILNVDDVEAHRYSISRLLARAGFVVTDAATGAEAIRQAIEDQPELVLLDIHLPDATGYDVCEKLKQSPETANIAVVHITASDKGEEAAMRSATVGADEYLTYPIVPKRLIHRIRELLQLRYLQRKKLGDTK